MKCPLCKDTEMNVETYEGVEIDVCPACGGVWLDKGELAKVVTTEEVKFTPAQIRQAIEEVSTEKEKREELMRHLISSEVGKSFEKMAPEEIVVAFQKRWGEARTINCPKCGVQMEEFDYAGTGVMIDRCPDEHGFWLDKGELDKVQIMMEYYDKLLSPHKIEPETTFTEKKCPHCNERMVERTYEGVQIDVCEKCGGVWLDTDELAQIVERREAKFSEGEKAFVKGEGVSLPSRKELVGDVHCPVCGVVMNKFVYGVTSGIVIDRCPRGDGVWLDKGELEKVQIYVEKSEDTNDEKYTKYTRIINQVKLDYQKRREEAIKNIKVSRLKPVNHLVQWMARRWD